MVVLQVVATMFVIFLFAVSAHDDTNTPQLLETLQSKDEEVQT